MNQELEEFKKMVVQTAWKYAEEYEMCEVVEEALHELGLSTEVEIEVAYTKTAKLSIDSRELRSAQQHNRVGSFLVDELTKRALINSSDPAVHPRIVSDTRSVETMQFTGGSGGTLRFPGGSWALPEGEMVVYPLSGQGKAHLMGKQLWETGARRSYIAASVAEASRCGRWGNWTQNPSIDSDEMCNRCNQYRLRHL